MKVHAESPRFSAERKDVNKERLKPHMIIFFKRVHFSDRREDLLDVPISAHIRFRQSREYLLHRVKMTNFSQRGFCETFLWIVITLTRSGVVERTP